MLPGVTNLTCVGNNWFYLYGTGGGRLELPAVSRLSGNSFYVYADGNNSVVDLSALPILAVGSGSQVQVRAQDGGKCDLRSVQAISGGSCIVIANGTGSVINLTNLSSFATPLGASELTAKNGGVILLPDKVFLLQNVAVNVAGNPVLPPVVSPGAALSLYGKAWHSYWVEVRDTRNPANDWGLFRRVPATNDLMVLGSAPKPWQAFRVWEFVADPAILDLSRGAGGQFQPVLFGAPSKSYAVETAPDLGPATATWEPTGLVTGPMTNSFRIFAPFTPLPEAQRFFRSTEQ